MNDPRPRRYIGVGARAVFLLLSQPGRSPERDLVERMLAMEPGQPFALDALAREVGQAPADVGRLMFALNRRAALSITTTAPAAWPHTNLDAGVQLALAQLTQTGGAVVLADSQGLLLAQAGSTAVVGERVAAGLGDTGTFTLLSTLHFHHHQLEVWTAGPVKLKHPAWVSMARLIQQTVGALSFGLRP